MVDVLIYALIVTYLLENMKFKCNDWNGNDEISTLDFLKNDSDFYEYFFLTLAVFGHIKYTLSLPRVFHSKYAECWI